MDRCLKTGKFCYSKKGAATMKNHRIRGKRSRGNQGRPKKLRIYPCPYCNCWHLTKQV